MSFLLSSFCEKKLLSWAFVGLPIFISSFLWSPSRDGLQIVFLLSFFIPIFFLFITNPKIFFQQGKINIFAYVYAAYASVASLWGEPSDFWHFMFVFVVLMIWLSGVSLIYTYKPLDIQKYLTYFCVVGAIFALGSTAYFHLFVSFDNRVWAWNVFRNPNEFGAACGVVSLIAFVMGLQSNFIGRSYFLFILSMLCFIGLVASFSRGALLAYVVTCSFALLVIRPRFKIWAFPVIGGLILASATVIVFKLYVYLQITGNFSNGRFEIWNFSLSQIENFWFGEGMSKNTSAFIPALGATVNHMHNAWLDTYYRTGFIGLILIGCHVYFVMRHFSTSPNILPFFLWFIFGIITMLFDGRSIFWEMGAKWFFYWIPAAFIAAIVFYSNSKIDKNISVRG